MATEQKSNGNAFEEDEIEPKEVIRKDFQEPSSSKVDPAAEQIGASTSKPISEDMSEDKDGRKDVKPEDEKAQDDKAKGDRGKDGETKSDKPQDDKAKVGEGRADKAKDDEGTGAKGKGSKGEKGKGAKGKDDKADHDTIQGDTAQDTTDAIPPQNVKAAIQLTKGGAEATSNIEQEEGCGMKCLMYTVECCECVIS